jgi:hypothetical protein
LSDDGQTRDKAGTGATTSANAVEVFLAFVVENTRLARDTQPATTSRIDDMFDYE